MSFKMSEPVDIVQLFDEQLFDCRFGSDLICGRDLRGRESMSALAVRDIEGYQTVRHDGEQRLADVIPFPRQAAVGRSLTAAERVKDEPSQPGGLAADQIARALRVVLFVAATLTLFLGAALLGSVIRPAPYDGPTWVHSVVQGESVWSLAESIGSSRALEDVVTDIYALNALGSDVLQPGQQVLLPTR